MFSVDGLRILYDLLDVVVSLSIQAASSRLWKIKQATTIQACLRGHLGRQLAKSRVSHCNWLGAAKLDLVITAKNCGSLSSKRRISIYQLDHCD